MSQYNYLKLPTDDSIRLVRVHESSIDTARIECSITIRKISDVGPEYTAVSYTWGQKFPRLPVFFPEQLSSKLDITLNCYSILQRLRQQKRFDWLWIDSISINQEDVTERSAQVRIMDRIYSSASEVLADLGEETQGSRLLFEHLAKTEQSKELQTLERATRNEEELCECCRYNELPLEPRHVEQLHELLLRPWFQRIWVIQEAVMGKRHNSVKFWCGSNTTSYEVLSACVYGFESYRVTKSTAPYIFDGDIDWAGHPIMMFWRHLINTRDNVSSDPRDRVYALLSLAKNGSSSLELKVDYAKSVEEVFVEAALLLLSHIGLRLLGAARHSHKLDMSSWIPDWSQSLPINSTGLLFWNQLGCTAADSLSPRYAVLKVRGAILSEICTLGKTFNFTGLEHARGDLARMLKYLGAPQISSRYQMDTEYIPEPIGRCESVSNLYC